MAKNNVRSNKRKEKKHVESGAISVLHSIIRSLRSAIQRATLFLGQVPAASVSAVLVKALPLLHRWLLNRLQKPLWNTAFVR